MGGSSSFKFILFSYVIPLLKCVSLTAAEAALMFCLSLNSELHSMFCPRDDGSDSSLSYFFTGRERLDRFALCCWLKIPQQGQFIQ